MNQTALKQLLDSCFIAKRIVETLPELPKGMKPRHIHVLDAIDEIRINHAACRVSDVSIKLNITMPSITKLIKELEALGMLEKYADEEDRRVTLLCLTDKGQACVKRHVHDLHSKWAEAMGDVSDEQVIEVISIIEQFWQRMPKGGTKENDKRD